MKTTRTLALVALLGVLAAPPAFAAQNGKAKGHAKAKAAKEQTQAKARDRAPDAQMRFRGMDKNGDGVITRAEWRGNDQSWRRHDTNGDGVLSGSEVQGQQQSPARVPVGDEESRRRDLLTSRFNRFDRDNDGRLGRNEWNGELGAFDRADLNRDGIVTRGEFLEASRERPVGTSGYGVRRTRAYQAGYDRGLTEGRQAGQEDRTVNGGKWDLDGQRELEQADSGYDARLGAREEYQAGYRSGFRLGYRQGFGPRTP